MCFPIADLKGSEQWGFFMAPRCAQPSPTAVSIKHATKRERNRRATKSLNHLCTNLPHGTRKPEKREKGEKIKS